jgi:propanol-preferring alcohol dehydrogenase
MFKFVIRNSSLVIQFGGSMRIPDTMHAMVLQKPGTSLVYRKLPVPKPGPDQVLIKVRACGVCRTDLHVMDGELPDPKLPIIPGHEIVGSVVETGTKVDAFRIGDRIGVPWVGYTCGECLYCRTGRENLCDRPKFTGYTLDGGYAEYAVADRRYCFSLPDSYSDAAVAPLLCAGLIGYRSYRMAGEDAERLGIYGFGGAAHIIAQIAVYQGRKVFAFTRPGDSGAQEFARRLGAVWAGDSTEMPPEPLDAAIIFAPIGSLVPAALRATVKGGTVVCGGIHMSDIPSFPYQILWEERVVRSVANLTRKDGEELLAIAPRVPVQTEVEQFPLTQANEALDRLREGKLQGAAVLITHYE